MDLSYKKEAAKFPELSGNRSKQILIKNKLILLNLRVGNKRYSRVENIFTLTV